MVERNCREHLIRRFAERGNELDPRDVKIASLKQQIQELEFSQLQQDSPTEYAKTDSNVWDDGSEDVNHFGGENHGFHDDHYDNPLFTKETESEPIIWDIGGDEDGHLLLINIRKRRKNVVDRCYLSTLEKSFNQRVCKNGSNPCDF
nr:hypothetical protein [Tanacetum cinerariifolium]